ncbi:SoxR reducing system RseC family protein [Desulfobotulus sp.]|uniref:SoxR reducing system RseC family protein n=1 Tax=Desulfobotulus sp. TaxID=1940337 RepID=UPI002A35B8FF|nr:SoxR reducing system RseC family protein [Desulfobotulus sp.]MDY0164686.1 SoxR reducing system RseC family protein [Desulfobotulus sp.]
MRTTEGIVTHSASSMATVRACRPEACAACKGRDFCGVNTATMEIRVESLPGLQAGDSVLLGIGSREVLRVMALLYLLPVAAFVLTCLGAYHAALRMQLPADPIAAAAGFLSLGLVFLLIRKTGQHLSRSPAYTPRILKRLPPGLSDFPDTPSFPEKKIEENSRAL